MNVFVRYLILVLGITGLLFFDVPNAVLARQHGAELASMVESPPTATHVTPLEQARRQIQTTVIKALVDTYFFSTKTTAYLTVSYPTIGWPKKEPLIRQVALTPSGIVSIWFSAPSSGDSYIDTSDYNSAEEAIVDILLFLKRARISRPMKDISVAAWGPIKDASCQGTIFDRMAFARLSGTQLKGTPFEAWSNLNGEEMFAQMKRNKISTEIYATYKACAR